MKKRRINPLEVVNEQCIRLRERLQAAADPREQTILLKRLKNLQDVTQFLAASCVYGENHHALQRTL